MAVALSRVTPAVVQRLQVPVQVLLYAGLFVFAEYLVGWLHLPLPANLVGMMLMLTLILCRVIPLKWVRAGARWLLAEMLLFFVPAVVAVVNYAQLLMVDGWRIFAVIALTCAYFVGASGGAGLAVADRVGDQQAVHVLGGQVAVFDLLEEVENLETREGCLEADTLEVLRIAAGHGGLEKLDLAAGNPANSI